MDLDAVVIFVVVALMAACFVVTIVYVGCLLYFICKYKQFRRAPKLVKISWILRKTKFVGDAGEQIEAPLWLRRMAITGCTLFLCTLASLVVGIMIT